MIFMLTWVIKTRIMKLVEHAVGTGEHKNAHTSGSILGGEFLD
jgi:hypothetical protein